MPRTSRTTECDPALSTGYHAPRRSRERTPSRTRAHRGPFTMSAHSDIARSMATSARAVCAVAYIPPCEGRQERHELDLESDGDEKRKENEKGQERKKTGLGCLRPVSPARLRVVQRAVRRIEEAFERRPIARVDGHADAHRDHRLLAIACHPIGDPARHVPRRRVARLRQHHGELVTAEPRRGGAAAARAKPGLRPAAPRGSNRNAAQSSRGTHRNSRG